MSAPTPDQGNAHDPQNASASQPNPKNPWLNVWTIAGGFGGILTIIGTIIAFLAFQQQRADSLSSDQAQATMIAIMGSQLEVQRELATVQANPVNDGPTATALAERRIALVATQQALDDVFQRASSTQTAIAQSGANPAASDTQPGVSTVVTEPRLVDCVPELFFGQTAQCDLSAAAEVDQYNFSAKLNDQVFIRMFRVSGDFYPRLNVADENGNTICQGSGNPAIQLLPCPINADGVYTVNVDDYYSQGTGKYRLYIQRMNNFALAPNLNFGESTNGQLPMTAEVSTYVFNAEMNDIIAIRFTKTAGAFYPTVNVWDASGRSICGTSSEMVVIIDCPINATGTYGITIDDYYQQATGNFSVLVQRINNPGNSRELSFGDAAEGAISVIGQFNSFHIDAQANDAARIVVNRISGSFYPRVGVFDKAGTLICSVSHSTDAIIQDCLFPADGRYFIYVDDYYSQQTGDFSLLVERI